MIRVDMAFDDVVVVNHDNTIANRLQIGAQWLRVDIPRALFHKKLRTICERDLPYIFASRVAVRVDGITVCGG